METGANTRGPLAPVAASRSGRRLWLATVYLLVPVLVGAAVPPAGYVPALWIVALGVWLARRGAEADEAAASPQPGRFAGAARRAAVRRMLVRFAAGAGFLLGAVALARPERLFDWPRERPWFWAGVVVLYPLLSVVPQEFLYRRVFFRRAGPLFTGDRTLVLVNALLFGAMHALYGNLTAVVLSAIGGWFFADTYRRTGSLGLVCLEHALYGDLIFTVGLGSAFSPGPPAG